MPATYTSLVGGVTAAGSIKYLVTYDRIDPETALEDAQSYLYGALRVREMQMGADVAIASGAETASLPARFLDPVSFRVVGWGKLTNRTWTQLDAMIAYETDGARPSGPPMNYAVWNELFQFDCKADAPYTGKLLYYGRPAALSSAAPSNFLGERYASLLLAACRMAAYDQMEDQGERETWQKRTDGLIARANIETDLVLRGADFLTTVR